MLGNLILPFITLSLTALVAASPIALPQPPHLLVKRAPECDVSGLSPTFPPDQEVLAVPQNQTLSWVVLGRGTQNYTCTDNNTWTNVGAVARAFDVSCLSSRPDFNSLPWLSLQQPLDPLGTNATSPIPPPSSLKKRHDGDGGAATSWHDSSLPIETFTALPTPFPPPLPFPRPSSRVVPSFLSSLANATVVPLPVPTTTPGDNGNGTLVTGQDSWNLLPNYLGFIKRQDVGTGPDNSTLIPVFDFSSSPRAGGVLLAQIVNTVPAPNSVDDIDYVELRAVGGDLGARTVFRTDTSGGQPLSSCTSGTDEALEVPYGALYWFYS